LIASFTLGGAVAFAWCRLSGDRPRSRNTAAAATGGGPTDTASLQTLIDAIPAIIDCKDRAGRYVLMNACQAALHGTTSCAARGQTAADLLGQERGAHIHGMDAQVFETGQPVGPVEASHPDAQGQERSWLTSKRPIKNAAGRVTHVVTAAFDITEYKRMEALLIQARNDAEAASRAKASFLATMSHELRTPLNAIIGFSELMHQAIHGPLGSAKYEEYVGNVRDSGRFLLSIINDILDLSKIEAGQMVFRGEAVDLSEVLQSCCRMVGPRARQDNIAIEIETEEALCSVHADRRLLIQIVTNLLSNAVKFSRADGRVRLAASARNRWVELRIIDQGAGMTEEEVAIALRPFEQVDREHARKHEGTGLGLPIAKALVDLHRGELAIDSRPGAGTTVTIRLPSHRSESGGLAADTKC
jgi:PAS domain S-box-containing protein